MRRLLPLMAVCLLSTTSLLSAADDTQFNTPTDEGEQEAKAFTDLQKRAAEYFRNREQAPATQRDDAKALQYLDMARLRLTTGHEIKARWWAEDAFEEFPYSKYAGDALRMGLEAAAVQGNIGQVREKLQMLWLFTPDYPGLGEAMERAMSVAEDVQDFSKSVNLAADKPSEVISLSGRSQTNDVQTNRLLRFLALHGDRDTIAPRAALGLARGLLLTGGKDERYEARSAYEKFLADYPATPLTFTAICEYALSYLVAYKGDEYDIGSVIFAAAIIDQAEIETRGDAARAETVKAYRTRIRAWHQDRDLAVARWFVDRGRPAFLQWLSKPPDLLSWEDGARYYYQAVIRRDPTSTQGRNAERELAGVPQVRPDTLTTSGQP